MSFMSQIVCRLRSQSIHFFYLNSHLFEELLTKEEFERYEKISFEELIGKNSHFVKCPNVQCSQIIEKISNNKNEQSSANETVKYRINTG